MKVIFVKDLRGQGKKGDIKEVKDGYGMNFLIKNGYAVIASDENLSKLKSDNKKKALQEAEAIKEAENLKKILATKTIKFKVKTGEQDKVFGSISVKQIVSQLKEMGYNIDKTQVKMTTPIQSLGFHNVELELHKKVLGNIKIEVIKER